MGHGSSTLYKLHRVTSGSFLFHSTLALTTTETLQVHVILHVHVRNYSQVRHTLCMAVTGSHKYITDSDSIECVLSDEL